MKKYTTIEERKAARKAVLRRYYLKNKESEFARTTKWRKENHDRSLNNLRNWRKKNHARYKANMKAYVLSIKEKISSPEFSKKRKEWRDNNKDKVRLWSRTARVRYPEKMRMQHMERYMRVKSLVHPKSSKADIQGIYDQYFQLTKSTGVKHVVDHIIPVAKGGWHHEDNLQPLPRTINDTKHSNPFWLSPSPAFKDWRDVPREFWPTALVPKYLALIEQHRGESIRWDTAA